MFSMAMGLLGALLPDMSCSVRTCGECRGCGADAEPPVGPMVAGGEGPATAWTVCGEVRAGGWVQEVDQLGHTFTKKGSVSKRSTCLVA